jgi:hypothetical protein
MEDAVIGAVEVPGRISMLVRGSLGMKKLAVLCIALCVSLSTTAAFARSGGGGSHHSSVTTWL